MWTLLVLGFALSIDSFRVSLGLGAIKLRPARQLQLALAFGLCDALAPLVGLLIGQALIKFIGSWAENLGPLILGGYGLYMIYTGLICARSGRTDPDRWIMFGLPLSLSLDNLVAGASLGMLRFPIFLSVTIIGVISGLMSLAGLRLGSTIGKLLPARAEVLGGIVLVSIAGINIVTHQ